MGGLAWDRVERGARLELALPYFDACIKTMGHGFFLSNRLLHTEIKGRLICETAISFEKE